MRSIDPRWILLTNHSLLLVFGVAVVNFQRSLWQIALALVTAVLFEILFAKWFSKESDRLGSRVLSSVITGLGLLLLVYSPSLWFYPFLAVVAVSSKYLIRRNKKEHVFNPTCFAIVFAFAVFPEYAPQLTRDYFLVSSYPTWQMIFLGLLVVWVARRWVLSLSYWLVLLGGAAVFHAQGSHSFMNIVGPELSVTGLLLSFFFITDPKTSPSEKKMQILFGAQYGGWNLFLKTQAVYASNFLALFFTLMIYPLIRKYYLDKTR